MSEIQSQTPQQAQPSSSSSAAPPSAPQAVPVKRQHHCQSCDCKKQLFYERGPVYTLHDKTRTRTFEVSQFTCASCGSANLFETGETAGGIS